MSIIDKVRKIISKATSTTHEGEAEVLMDKARRLMEDHQIGLDDLLADDPIGTNRPTPATAKSGPSSYKVKLSAALARYYGCRCVYDFSHWAGKEAKWFLEVNGPESARVTHELMLDFVWQQCKDAAGKLPGNKGSNLRMVVNALCARIHHLTVDNQVQPKTEAATNALVVIGDALAQYLEQRYEGITPGRKSVRRSTADARQAAAGISLARQTEGKVAARLE